MSANDVKQTENSKDASKFAAVGQLVVRGASREVTSSNLGGEARAVGGGDKDKCQTSALNVLAKRTVANSGSSSLIDSVSQKLAAVMVASEWVKEDPGVVNGR